MVGRAETQAKFLEKADAFQERIPQRPSKKILEFAARCVLRLEAFATRNRVGPEDARLAEFTRDLTEYALWLAYSSMNETDTARISELHDKVGGALKKEHLIARAYYKAAENHVPWMEMARLPHLLLRAVSDYLKSGKGGEGIRSYAASLASYSIMVVEFVDGPELAKRISAIIDDDLRCFEKGNEIRFGPVWPSEGPEWSHTDVYMLSLSRAEESVSRYSVEEFDRKTVQPPADLSAATLPISPVFKKGMLKTQAAIERLHQKQLELFQGTLDSLIGVSFGSGEKHRELAVWVTQMVTQIGGVLTISGVFEDNKKKIHVYENQPVTIRSDGDHTTSYKLRTADGASTYVTSTTTWPELRVVSRKSLSKSQK